MSDFDRRLSRAIDAIDHALDDPQSYIGPLAWLRILYLRWALRRLERKIPT